MKKLGLLILILLTAYASFGQDSTYAVRVMHYNLMSFGVPATGCTFDPNRYNTLETVLNYYRPHLFTVNEVAPNELYRQNILRESIKYSNTMAVAPLVVERQSARTNLLFYDEAWFGFLGTLPCPDDDCVLSSNGVRDIHVYELFFKPSIWDGGDTTFITLIVAHFKASDGSANENARNLSAQDIMSWVGSRAADQNVLLLGDLNLGFSGEAAWQTLIANSNPSLSFRDPINKLTGWGGASNASLHTQSTRGSGSGCFVGGGLDDRFDFILASNEVMDGTQGATYQSGSYDALGNDGTDFDQGIVCSGNTSVPGAVCQALFNTSDHLPVVLTLEMGGGATSGLPDWSSAIRVGPQPVQDQLYVAVEETTSASGIWQLVLRDTYGRILTHTEGLPNWQLSLGSWPAGVYLLEIIDPRGRSLQHKVLKVRL